MTRNEDRPRDPAEERAPIATRGPAPTPRRLSRKALATLAGVSALGIAAALGYSLSTSHLKQAPQEAVSVKRSKSDVLADAPKDYSDVSRFAPAAMGPPPSMTEPETTSPLSGSSPSSSPSSTDNEAAAERQRRRQSGDSARASKLFASTSEGSRSAVSSSEVATNSPVIPTSDPPATGAAADPQDRKAAFVAGGVREPTENSGRLTAAAERYVVLAGSTVAAALITGLSSDLPGQVVAQVTEDVFDTVTGHMRLIPQGTRLIGVYDARVSYGQSRALVVWTRLILPDGRSIDLDRMIGTDAAGQSGFADRVNNHTGRLLVGGLLSTLFGLGANVATSGNGNNSDIAAAIRQSAGRTVEDAGDKIVERDLSVQPTITIRPGAKVRVLVSRDLLLAPWQGS